MFIQKLLIISFSIFSISALSQTLAEENLQEDNFIYVENGRLYHPNGDELALWGVNLQSMLSWEYNSLMKKAGIPKNADVWKKMVDNALDELEIINCRIIRAHLTPADFTDANGDLVQTIYLDLLDYTVAEAAKRGIFTYLTFLNHMGNYEVWDSFMRTIETKAKDISVEDKKLYSRAMLMFDTDERNRSINYITSLLNRINPYSTIQYKNDTSMLVWEIMNEPLYMTYNQLKAYTAEYNNYKVWLSENNLTEENGLHYPSFRKQKVLDYINTMYEAVMSAGANQPIAWNCNWHRMINGREDVFDAIAESKMKVVSFCNYPGQGLASQNGPYWENPIDLTNADFSSWYKECYENREWYGWAIEPRFSDKAKIVYEFETFFNQSAYLYPVMADFLRSVGVQAATMWHYSFTEYATYRNGSHLLNLKCTPRKAASFAIASKIFENTPILQAYHSNETTEWISDNYMYSYEKNLSIFSSENEYLNSGTLYQPEQPMPKQELSHILGYGSSPAVKYCGSGVYNIDVSPNEINIHIEPNSGWLRPPWEKDNMSQIVTMLDYDRAYLMEIRLDSWFSNNCKLFRVENGQQIEQSFLGSSLKFVAKPGNYRITKN